MKRAARMCVIWLVVATAAAGTGWGIAAIGGSPLLAGVCAALEGFAIAFGFVATGWVDES